MELPTKEHGIDITGFLPPAEVPSGADPKQDPDYVPIDGPIPTTPLRVQPVEGEWRLADKASWLFWAALRNFASGIVVRQRDQIKVIGVDASAKPVSACDERGEERLSAAKNDFVELELDLEVIRTDGDTQLRESLDVNTVAAYAEAIDRGEKLPPITVVQEGDIYWLVGGFHRLEAYRRMGKSTIEAMVKLGTHRDALLMAVGENSKHGLPRSPTDKRRAVQLMLRDEEWSRWSAREIGRLCDVSHTLVSTMRNELSGDGCQIEQRVQLNGLDPASAPNERKITVRRGGTVYKMAVRGLVTNDETEGGSGQDIGVADPAPDGESATSNEARMTGAHADDSRVVALPVPEVVRGSDMATRGDAHESNVGSRGSATLSVEVETAWEPLREAIIRLSEEDRGAAVERLSAMLEELVCPTGTVAGQIGGRESVASNGECTN